MIEKSFHARVRATSTRAVLFDLDGTLIDSLHDIAAALNGALQRHALPRVRVADARRYIGDGVTTLCRRAAPRAADDIIAALRKDFYEVYDQLCVRRTRFYPGVARLLARLAKARVPMGVVSNKPDSFARRIVAALAHPRWFAVVRGARADRDRKPDPRMALEAARRLRRSPADVLFVGDSPVDIQTARNAGMIAVAVAWGFRGIRSLKAAQPDALIRTPRELVPIALGGGTD